MTGGQERDKKGYLKSACSRCSGRCAGRQRCDLLELSSPVTELDVTDRALCLQHRMSQVIYMGLFSLEEARRHLIALPIHLKGGMGAGVFCLACSERP